jgi:hypothetical protein
MTSPYDPASQPSFTQHQQPSLYGQPPRPPKPSRSWLRRHKLLTAFGLAGGLMLINGVAAAAGNHPANRPGETAVISSTTAAPATTTEPAPASSSALTSAPAQPSTVATFTGSGIQNTPKFDVTDTWKLAYSFSCAGFGQSGNFQVYEDGGFSGVSVNDLALSKNGETWAYNDAGTHYLQINSECDWTVKVIDEP